MSQTKPEFPVFDGHNDTLLRLHQDSKRQFFKRNKNGHIDMPRAQEGGFAGGFFAIFVPNKPKKSDKKKRKKGKLPNKLPKPVKLNYAQQTVMAMISELYALEAEPEGGLKVIKNIKDLRACIRDGVMGAILHFEGAEAIDEDLHALDVFYQAGLRSLGIVWSRKTIFAEGVPFRFPHTLDTGPGLTKAGKQLVKRCNELGIMIDLSHMNEKGFWDVAKRSKAPLVATHSNVHALSPTPRNLTDKQLDAIKDSDGMVGLNFATGFLREDGKMDSDTPIEVMVKHIDYLVEKLGIDRVGLGSDFDGATIPDEIGDVAGLPKLVAALKDAGYNKTELNKITHKNWIRVLNLTWKD